MDRRPIETRNATWAQALAGDIARTGISPNAVSLVGLAFGLIAGLVFACTRHGFEPRWMVWAIGALCVQLRLLCNMLDGLVADAQKSHSPVGSLYNEVPDRAEDVATLAGFGFAAGSWPTLGYVAAILAVLSAYIRTQSVVSGAPQDFGGPMAKQHRMFLVTLGALVAIFWEPAPRYALMAIIAGTALTCGLRLRRAAAYLRRQT